MTQSGGEQMNQKTLQQKQQLVEEVVSLIDDNESFVIVEYRGLSVQKINELRRMLRSVNAKMVIYKNTMVQRAVEKLNHEALLEFLTGPNAIVLANESMDVLKVIFKFAKKQRALVIKGGLIDGRVMSDKEIKTLATLPGREGVISMLLSCLQSPIRSVAVALKAVADQKN
jgi:large subunit ribosomal protein L10